MTFGIVFLYDAADPINQSRTTVANPPPPSTQVNCWQCKHFATSWDPKMPYSCKLLGFKSQILPSIQVMNSDGRPCFGFDAKPTSKPQ
jgi:hypothetical protein